MTKDDPIKSLTPRERQVLLRIADGKTHREIGQELGISSRTVEIFIVNLKRKLESRNTMEAVRYAISCGLVPKEWKPHKKHQRQAVPCYKSRITEFLPQEKNSQRKTSCHELHPR